MILVDDAGGAFPAINHAPWFGVTLADFVMPFFLFGVGVSVSLVFKVSSNTRIRVLDYQFLKLVDQQDRKYNLENRTVGYTAFHVFCTFVYGRYIFDKLGSINLNTLLS